MNSGDNAWLLYLKSSSSIRKKVLSNLDVSMKKQLEAELNNIPKLSLSVIRKAFENSKTTHDTEVRVSNPEHQEMTNVLNFLVQSESFSAESLPEAYVVHSRLSPSMKRALLHYTNTQR
ncbi:hypothetical protein MHN79_06575 [Vibrio sp. Of14-4]|uniref:hypothetical protein n=1 Tax=Vibrio sp. Of14-4 TaxID=2724878 RepID=UPI001EF1B74A|nr:hypothetical protein [Vibrio sp. Of14-4]MCG7489148.1 hypothetical protein [Vibrio sp. Of14-4]